MIELLLLKRGIGATGVSRGRMLALALLPAAALADFAAVAVLVYLLSLSGVFLPVVRQGLGADPAAWVLWFADPAWAQVLLAAAAGLAGGFVFRKWPVLSALAMVLAFPGFLSVKALATLFLAERLGFRLRDWRDGVDPAARGIALLTAAAGLLAILVCGQLGQMLWNELIGFESIFHPRSRFVLTGLVVGLGLGLETALNMVIFHFRYQRLARSGPA